MPATTLPSATNANDLVFLSPANEPLTDTFLVAEYFGKNHKDILRKIKQLDCSESFMAKNFKQCERPNPNQNNKLQPFYQMTKDGFMFLVMGFTGKKAAMIKEEYITAFNVMTERLATPPQPLPLELFTSEDELMRKFLSQLQVRILLNVEGGKVASTLVVPEDAFVCNKERLLELMANNRIFTDQDIVSINLVAANRISEM